MTRHRFRICRCCGGLAGSTYCDRCGSHRVQQDATVQAVILATFGTEG